MSDHESFEQLCALATTGDLDTEEFRRLREHLLECASCRASYDDFQAIVERGFPALESPARTRWLLPKFGFKKRFNARARKEGIALHASSRSHGRTWRILEVTALMLLVIGLSYSWRMSQSAEDRRAEAASQIAALSSKITDLEKQLSERREPEAAAAPAPAPTPPVDSAREQDLERQLALLRSDYDNALTGRNLLEESVSSLSAELGQVRRDTAAFRSEAERLQRNLQTTETALTRTTQELESLGVARVTNVATIAQQRIQLDLLNATIREQTETIQRERELLAKEKDIRDLVGARDLLIIDVQDVGASGKVRNIPGRIFYTHGKKLTFYAYDLQNKGNVNRAAFQVWGKKDGRSQPPRSLGILYEDDSTQKRWALTFDEPAVLAEIDQVFVTVEPPGGSRQPTTKQILNAAFINEAPNHP